MPSNPIIQGWCPGALRPMMSGDGLVVRVRMQGGRITSDELKTIAALSDQFGNGVIDVTRRANLQIRGVSAVGHKGLTSELRKLGVIDADVFLESRRNIVMTPLRDPESNAILDMLTALLPDLPELSGKFGFAIDTGLHAVLQDTSCDIRIERTEKGKLLLRLDGMAHGIVTSKNALPDQIKSIATWFATHGLDSGRGRMATLIKRGVRPEGFDAATAPRAQHDFAKAGPLWGGMLMACAYGQMPSSAARALVQLKSDILITPWRALFVPDYAQQVEIKDLISDPNDPRLQIAVCPGAPMCPQALGETRGLANKIAPHLPPSRMLHISGCAKGCAAHTKTEITLTAQANGYDLIHHGRASDAATKTALSLATLTATPEIIFEG